MDLEIKYKHDISTEDERYTSTGMGMTKYSKTHHITGDGYGLPACIPGGAMGNPFNGAGNSHGCGNGYSTINGTG